MGIGYNNIYDSNPNKNIDNQQQQKQRKMKKKESIIQTVGRKEGNTKHQNREQRKMCQKTKLKLTFSFIVLQHVDQHCKLICIISLSAFGCFRLRCLTRRKWTLNTTRKHEHCILNTEQWTQTHRMKKKVWCNKKIRNFSLAVIYEIHTISLII